MITEPKMIYIQGVIARGDDANLTEEEFSKNFFRLIEGIGWEFGGIYKEYKEEEEEIYNDDMDS